MKPILPTVLLAFLAVQPALAAERYRFDAVHSQVSFHVSHLGFSISEGEFHDISGGFTFEPDDWSKAQCDVRIGVASIDLDDDGWNRKLLGADWFDVEKHPAMQFRCLRAVAAEAGNARVEGELTLRGVTRPVTLDVHFNRAAVHKYSLQYIAGFSAKATIRRSDFGMVKLLPEVGEDIEIRLEIEGIREGKKRDRNK